MSLKLDRTEKHWAHIPIKEEGPMTYYSDPTNPSHIKDISRVTKHQDSEEDTRVLLQLKILRRNDAGKDHAMIVDYDSGKTDCITICDELQKGAGKLSLSRKEIQILSYMLRECNTIAHIVHGKGDEDGPF